MSTLGSIYTGLSGMLSFSKGLNVISDNVANMNTPGYKGSDARFSDLFYRYHASNITDAAVTGLQIGTGVEIANTTTRFTQGEVRNTGNQTDVAINGNGYFILFDGHDQLYTRAGQFDIDQEGYLVSKDNGLRVAGFNDASQLKTINIGDYRISPPKETSEIKFVNNLSTGGISHELTDIEVFDSLGKKHMLKVTFTNNNGITPRSWLLEVFDENDNSVSTGEIRFQGNGSPETGYNTHQFTFTPPGGQEMTITLNFGDPGSFIGATSFSGGSNSTLSIGEVNGYGVGSVSEISFNENGEIEISYSNEQKQTVGTLALAYFTNQQILQKLGNGVYANPEARNITVGRANEDAFGTIIGKSLELSNVELTQQFTDLVVIQRGFQSSSQILTVANEMVQEFINSSKGRG